MAEPIIPLVEPGLLKTTAEATPSGEESVDEDDGNPFTEKTDILVAKALEVIHVQGLAIAVINRDKIYSKGYGYSDLEHKHKIEPSTLFAVGSTTKSFTSAAMSLIMDDSKFPTVNWDTPLAKIIPEDFVLDDEYLTQQVTIKDALSHRTGMPGHGLVLQNYPIKQSTRNLRHLFTKPKEFRSKWDYNNLMVIAVCHAMEVLTSQPLGLFIKEKIWEPLGMNQTFWSHDDALKYLSSNPEVMLSESHRWDSDKEEYVHMPYWDDSGVSGSGSIVSNVVDFAKWIKSFINQGGPLSTPGYTAVTTPVMPMPPQFPRIKGLCYAMGWMVGVYRGERIVFHPGGTDSYVSNMLFLPDKKFGVVGMVNSANNAVINAPLFSLIDDFLGVPEDQREDDGLAKSIEQTKAAFAQKLAFPQMLYPEVPSPPLPPSIPLSAEEAYVGLYEHGAYGIVTMSFIDGKLHGHLDTILPVDFYLNHVSSNYFIMNPTSFFLPMMARAEFDVGVKGKVERLGLQLEGMDEGGPKIWFLKK